jgi:hypothetical protein
MWLTGSHFDYPHSPLFSTSKTMHIGLLVNECIIGTLVVTLPCGIAHIVIGSKMTPWLQFSLFRKGTLLSNATAMNVGHLVYNMFS